MRVRTPYRGFGAAFCQEAEVALERLRRTIEAAQRAGFLVRQTSEAYEAAVEIYARETGWSSKTYVAWGSACTNLTNEIQQAVDRLNAEITAAGSKPAPIYRPDFIPDPQGWDALPGVAKIAIVLGGIGLVAWALNSVATVAGVFKPLRGPVLAEGSKDRVQKRRIY